MRLEVSKVHGEDVVDVLCRMGVLSSSVEQLEVATTTMMPIVLVCHLNFGPEIFFRRTKISVTGHDCLSTYIDPPGTFIFGVYSVYHRQL